ncbi:hypothetical protein MBCUT_10350 [Methanobrevibacter cuticularis]|uniref:Right handed beta helix domain-containing protein n=1 Tax=Methanobrevibacter cuticularis TaxID=47311 RepID=A0A166E1C5_9EURY|nr:right-handed parallel beta-helix repeat-containing protein [Methanobrevibacter cuticularis]KZX16169.1 hypothetical protein MBCUT_10350 [Methanobrevibacter cuticularis]
MKFKMLCVLLLFLLTLIMAGSVSATEYKVNVGNSTTDIDNIINTMNPTDTLFFEDGVYQNKTVSINKNNITLTANRGKVLFNGSGISYEESAFSLSGSYITIENINISNYYNGISVSSGHNTIKNCDLQYNENGINASGNFNTILSVISSNNKNNGILIVGSDNIVSDCRIYANYDGLWIVGNRNKISNISSYDNKYLYDTTYGIFIYGNDNLISNFTSYNNSMGISVEGSYNSLRNGNTYFNSVGISIEGNYNNVTYCNGSDNTMDGIIIVGNYSNIINSIASNNYFGIFILGRYGNITGCTANYNGQWGIHTASDADPILTGENNVSNSIAIGNNFYGIFLEGGNDCIINSTVAYGMFGIYMSKDNNRIYNSKVSNANYGILIERGSYYNITGNILHDNLVAFIFAEMDSVNNVNIDFNHIFNNTQNFEVGTYYSTSNIIANYNWWGGNPPTNEFQNEVSIQYYIKGVTLTNSSNAYRGTNLTLNYGFVLNDSSVITTLPSFVAYIVYFDNIINLNGSSKGYINVTLNSSNNVFYLFFNNIEFTNFSYVEIPRNANIYVNDASTTFGNQVNIEATFIYNYHTLLSNENLTLNIYGSTYYATTNALGIAVFYNIPSLNTGSFQFTINYTGTYYEVSSVTGNLIVNPINNTLSLEFPNISYVNDNITINISLKESNNPLENVDLRLVIDNKEYNIKTNNEGIAILYHKFNKEGTFEIVVYLNENQYTENNLTKYIYIYKKPSSISMDNYNGIYNKVIYLKATLTHNKQGVKDQYIDFYINNKYIGTGKTNASGIATFSYIVKSTGKITVKAIHKTNDEYFSDVKLSYLNIPKLSIVKLKNTQKIIMQGTGKSKKKTIKLQTIVYNYGPDKTTFKISYKIPKNLKVKKILTSKKLNKATYNKKIRTITWQIKNMGIIKTKKISIKIYLKGNKQAKYSIKPKVQKVNGLKVDYNNVICS